MQGSRREGTVRVVKALGPEVVKQIHARLCRKSPREEGDSGRKMRVDTTVTETNIQYPTDSGLLEDGVETITRKVDKINALLGAARG